MSVAYLSRRKRGGRRRQSRQSLRGPDHRCRVGNVERVPQPRRGGCRPSRTPRAVRVNRRHQTVLQCLKLATGWS
jgi:hypothetical protein